MTLLCKQVTASSRHSLLHIDILFYSKDSGTGFNVIFKSVVESLIVQLTTSLPVDSLKSLGSFNFCQMTYFFHLN